MNRRPRVAFVEYGGNRQGLPRLLGNPSRLLPDPDWPTGQAPLAEQEAEARRRQEDEIESFEITSEPKPKLLEGEEEEEEEIAGEDEPAPLLNLDMPLLESSRLFATATTNIRGRSEGDDVVDDQDEVFVNHPGAASDPYHDHEHDEDDQSLSKAGSGGRRGQSTIRSAAGGRGGGRE